MYGSWSQRKRARWEDVCLAMQKREQIWCKVREKQPNGSGQLWDLWIREVRAHSTEEICKIFLTVSIAMSLQAQPRPLQTDCFAVSQWEAHFSAVVPGMQHSAASSQLGASLLPWRLDLEVAHGPEEDAKAAEEGLQHLLDLQRAEMGPTCVCQRCVFQKTPLFRLSWEFCHLSMGDY